MNLIWRGRALARGDQREAEATLICAYDDAIVRSLWETDPPVVVDQGAPPYRMTIALRAASLCFALVLLPSLAFAEGATWTNSSEALVPPLVINGGDAPAVSLSWDEIRQHGGITAAATGLAPPPCVFRIDNVCVLRARKVTIE